jgi:hypothetical protein
VVLEVDNLLLLCAVLLCLFACRFKAYVQQAQKERDRRSAAQVLKKLVQVRPASILQ